MRKIRGLIRYDEYLDMSPFIEDVYKYEECNSP